MLRSIVSLGLAFMPIPLSWSGQIDKDDSKSGKRDKRIGKPAKVKFDLTGEIYYLEPNTSQLPDFSKLKPVAVLHTKTIDVPARDYRDGYPGVKGRIEWFAIDFKGTIKVPRSGTYAFLLTSDDGSKLYIDDNLLIDNDGVHNATTEEGIAGLTAGEHRIRVSYFRLYSRICG